MSSNFEEKRTSLGVLFDTDYGKIVFSLTAIVIVVLMTDTLLIKLSDFFVTSFNFEVSLISFIAIAATFGAGQFLFLRLVGEKIKAFRVKGSFSMYLHKVVLGVQYALAAILVLITLELLTISQYSVNMLIASVTISYSLGAAAMLILARYFLLWYKMNKDYLMLAYGVSAVVLAVHLVFTFSFVDYVLSGLPTTMHTPFYNPPFFATGSLEFALNSVHTTTSIVTFITMWVATALLLHEYSQKLGAIRYWVLISLPLVYFLSQFPTVFFNLFDPIIKQDPLFYGTLLIVIFALSKPAGGILFGVAFWSAAMRVRRDAAVRDYLILCGYGFVLLFTADQGITLINAAYPPFGIATISFMGLSAYLILNGILYSAASVSQDARLRREIRKLATSHSKLLGSISSAQFEKEVRDKLVALTRYEEDMRRRTGAEPSINENEAMDYLDEVLRERVSSEKMQDDEDSGKAT